MANHVKQGFQYARTGLDVLGTKYGVALQYRSYILARRIQTGRYTTETPGPLPHGKCNISSSRARMDGLACIPLCELPLRLEPDAGLDEGTSSLELGQPGQATTTIRILRDLVHNANANGLTWEQFDWIRAKK